MSWYDEIPPSENSFPYTTDQIVIVAKITISFVALSFFASSLVLLLWLIMWFIERPQLNRVSLRCVAIASAVNLIDGIFDIIMWSIDASETTCRGLSLTVDFLDVVNVALLAVVGINLVLVVVLSVRKRDTLERFYYPCILVYSAVVIVVPLYEEIVHPVVVSDTIDCWYYDNVAERGLSKLSWMWFYVFIFFAALVGLLSVLVAIAYLARAERAVRNDMETARRSSHPSISSAFRRSSAINQPRVVLRCILYPLVPLVVHIWGFVIQIIVTVDKQVPLGLVVMYGIFSSIEGFLTALVFFSEPTVVTFTSRQVHRLMQAYVYDFALVDKESVVDIPKANIPESISNGAIRPPERMKARPPLVSSDSSESNDISWPSTPSFSGDDREKNDRQGNLSRLGVPSPSIISRARSSPRKSRPVPMRRLSISASIYQRMHQEQRRASRASFTTAASSPNPSRRASHTTFVSADYPDEVYVPYRSPAVARFLHWVLSPFNRGSLTSTTTRSDVISHNTQYSDYTLSDIDRSQQNSPRSPMDCS